MPLQIKGHRRRAPADPARPPVARAARAWPADTLVALPRGISRHVVRFVRVDGAVYAVKETPNASPSASTTCCAPSSGSTRRASRRWPSSPTGSTDAGEPLESVLITRHLKFSLPYRALFSRTLRPETTVPAARRARRATGPAAPGGFFWGDCRCPTRCSGATPGRSRRTWSTPRRGRCTGSCRPGSAGRTWSIARINIFGEMLDLAGGRAAARVDRPGVGGRDIVRRYEALWHELTYEEELATGDVRRSIESRIRRLNDLGFDVAELQILLASGRYRVRPKVVDAGHHSRRLLRLTGLDAEENQARRAAQRPGGGDHAEIARRPRGARPEELAHRWVADASGRWSAGCRPKCAASWSPRRSSTSSWSTAGTCPSRRAATSAWRRP